MSETPRYGRGQVIDIINSVVNKMETTQASRDVFEHVAELAQIIDSLRKDIKSYNPEHVKNSHIPDATDELDAVVSATAEATNKIMNACEEIETIANGVDENIRDQLNSKTAEIYEACGFQDITGQRIRNVVGTLRVIESKVDQIMDTLGEKVGIKMSESRVEKVVSIDDERSLLNGPQLPDKAITQEDIDKLLAEFDN